MASDDRRQAIVEAARRVFRTRGLENASMRLIAREAGCTTGTIYPLYGSKEELYAEILTQSLVALKQVVTDASGTALPGNRGRAVLQAFFDYYRQHPTELSLGLYLYQGARPVGLTAALDERLNATLLQVFRIISSAIQDDGRTDAGVRTTSAIAHAIGLLILERTQRLRLFGTPVEDLMARYLDQL